MNGRDNLLMVDTNILLYLDSGVKKAAESIAGKTLYLSFISEIELLGFPNLSKSKLKELADLLEWFEIVDFSSFIKRKAIEIKQHKKIKVPDAIIAATAIVHDLPLLTADSSFTKIPGLRCIVFEGF